MGQRLIVVEHDRSDHHRDPVKDWRVLAFAGMHSGIPAMSHMGAILKQACEEIGRLRGRLIDVGEDDGVGALVSFGGAPEMNL